MTKPKKILITLAIFAGVFFMSSAILLCKNPSIVLAKTSNQYSRQSTHCSKPWDTHLSFCYDDKIFQYRLSDNLSHLTSDQLTARLIFRSSSCKAKWLIAKTKQGIPLPVATFYIFPRLQDLFEEIQMTINYQPKSSEITFNPDSQKKFTYTTSADGLQVDVEETCKTLLKGLNKGETHLTIQIVTRTIAPQITTADALKSTVLRGSFETSCVNSSNARQNNVALALSYFNGMIVEKNQTVSFNQVVGERTAERGFSVAKVLVNGNYIDGVGGGVCQASTTLFNALLVSDVGIKGVCQHSVKSSYVSPSFDAMVTDAGADLVFINNTQNRLYISASCQNGKARVEIYGVANPYEIVRRTNVIKEIDYATTTIVDTEQKYTDKVTYVDETYLLTAGVKGVASEGWLDYKKDGKIVFSKKIRTNYYKPIDCVILQGAKEREEQN